MSRGELGEFFLHNTYYQRNSKGRWHCYLIRLGDFYRIQILHDGRGSTVHEMKLILPQRLRRKACGRNSRTGAGDAACGVQALGNLRNADKGADPNSRRLENAIL